MARKKEEKVYGIDVDGIVFCGEITKILSDGKTKNGDKYVSFIIEIENPFSKWVTRMKVSAFGELCTKLITKGNRVTVVTGALSVDEYKGYHNITCIARGISDDTEVGSCAVDEMMEVINNG